MLTDLGAPGAPQTADAGARAFVLGGSVATDGGLSYVVGEATFYGSYVWGFCRITAWWVLGFIGCFLGCELDILGMGQGIQSPMTSSTQIQGLLHPSLSRAMVPFFFFSILPAVIPDDLDDLSPVLFDAFCPHTRDGPKLFKAVGLLR